MAGQSRSALLGPLVAPFSCHLVPRGEIGGSVAPVGLETSRVEGVAPGGAGADLDAVEQGGDDGGLAGEVQPLPLLGEGGAVADEAVEGGGARHATQGL